MLNGTIITDMEILFPDSISTLICNLFAPNIKGTQRVTCPGLRATSCLHYKGFLATSIFIIEVGSFDYGIYLITAIE